MPRRPALWATAYAGLTLFGVVAGVLAGALTTPATAGTPDPRDPAVFSWSPQRV